MPFKIYTKTGDKGETGLIGGGRVRKDDLRMQAIGDVDETNAALGVARSLLGKDKPTMPLAEELDRIQTELFELGAELAADPAKPSKPRITPAHAKALEQAIDKMTKELPQLKSFILPGGSRAGACLHLARTISRRAERSMVALGKSAKVSTDAFIYINRLSDYLFTLARIANLRAGRPETPWIPS